MQRERPPPPKTWQQQSKRYKTKYMNALKSLYGDTLDAKEDKHKMQNTPQKENPQV
jgi:hypothetical protein